MSEKACAMTLVISLRSVIFVLFRVKYFIAGGRCLPSNLRTVFHTLLTGVWLCSLEVKFRQDDLLASLIIFLVTALWILYFTKLTATGLLVKIRRNLFRASTAFLQASLYHGLQTLYGLLLVLGIVLRAMFRSVCEKGNCDVVLCDGLQR